MEGVGIGTAADAVNRLSVTGEATLLSHAGGGHRLKINKAAEAEVAALIYQSDWAGHAELGLVGDNDLHLRVSADGNTWTEALVVASATGLITGEAVQSGPADVTSGRLARADYVYGPGNLLGPVTEAAGAPVGAVIERGSTAEGEYVRFADGTQICTCVVTLESASGPSAFLEAAVPFPRAFAAVPSVSLTLDQASYLAGVSGSGPALDQLGNLGLMAPSVSGCMARLMRMAGAPDFQTGDGCSLQLSATGRWV